jgi:Methyltransferase domain
MEKKKPNQQYNLAAADSVPVRVATFQRRRMYERFSRVVGTRQDYTILDVGVTADRSYSSSNVLEAWHPFRERITAVGIDDASFLEREYPGLSFVRASGLQLPFGDRSFDVVHSSAVLEHVGNFDNQVRLISECTRVANRALFMTTPNRWFPVEFHTMLPLVHWLPKSHFRTIMRKTGREFFAEEANLNLMSRNDLRSAAAAAIDPVAWAYRIEVMSLVGWPSNLLLIATSLHPGNR